uniref:pilus assembly protein TadG-related protein n=1 Tax=uncultured Sphingomonas sp. TaxID=158754 RepID=UPI0026010D24|nr:pilus assembly protein TadG-related protein [uncultured Sphingomonas sp.]
MLGFLRALWRDKRGNVLILMAAGMPMLIGMAGLATDTIQWALWKRQLQRAADSAAIAGVYQRNVTPLGATTSVSDAILRDLALNQHAGTLLEAIPAACPETGDPILTCPADEGTGAGRRMNQVSVTLKLRKELAFSSFFMSAPPTITVSAKAASVPGAGEYCVIALDRRNVVGIDIGGSTNVNLGNCCLIANSTHPNQAFKNTGSGSTVRAGCIAAAGGVEYSESPNWNVDNYYPYSEPAADPYADLPTPEEDDCDPTLRYSFGSQLTTDRNFTDGPLTPPAESHTGKTICIDGGFDIKANLTLGAATYIINTSGSSDNLSMTQTGARLTCDGCTIILTNFDDPAETGNVRLNGGTVNISAPDATAVGNPYMGVVLYQDRRAEDDDKRGTNHVNGNNTIGVQGVIYMPTRSLMYNGGGGVAQNKCMQLIAARVDFSGNSGFNMGSTCGHAGMRGHTGGGWLVRLVA